MKKEAELKFNCRVRKSGVGYFIQYPRYLIKEYKLKKGAKLKVDIPQLNFKSWCILRRWNKINFVLTLRKIDLESGNVKPGDIVNLSILEIQR